MNRQKNFVKEITLVGLSGRKNVLFSVGMQPTVFRRDYLVANTFALENK